MQEHGQKPSRVLVCHPALLQLRTERRLDFRGEHGACGLEQILGPVLLALVLRQARTDHERIAQGRAAELESGIFHVRAGDHDVEYLPRLLKVNVPRDVVATLVVGQADNIVLGVDDAEHGEAVELLDAFCAHRLVIGRLATTQLQYGQLGSGAG